MTEPPEERYLAIDLAVFAAIKELDWLRRVDWQLLPAMRLILRVVHVEPATGNLLIGAQVVRDLDEDKPPERGLGSI
jgi:hypothetical protein